eukprot:m.44018 g.44018  ORF g.44018 m.44018 type:complete len:232 (+) comp10036_c0_seq2:460-1155(+)
MPLCRMVDPALTEGMVEYIVGHVLRHHLEMDKFITKTADPQIWSSGFPPLARERHVAILGLGQLGTACARALQNLNFKLLGWGRTPKDVNDLNIKYFHGEEGLKSVLKQAEIVIILLPNTPETEKLMDGEHLGLLPKGAVLINAGRGSVVDETALLKELDEGRLEHATLDVFCEEPLPESHVFWKHPRVTVTPHIAAATRPKTAAQVLVQNIQRGESGLPFLHQVERERGY